MGYDKKSFCIRCGFATPHCACPINLQYERPVQKQAKPTMVAMQVANGEFKKFDKEKDQWHLMPEAALTEVLKVLMDGAKKYGDFNWLDNAHQVDIVRYMNALERHLKSFKQGGNKDAESGHYEMAHIACNALFILTMQMKNLGTDTRRTNGTK